MNIFLLSPPFVFLIVLLTTAGLCYLASFLAAPGKESQRKLEAYACGQRGIQHAISPDYSQFFPFAFFFTIMHVLVMVIATAPSGAVALPLLYVAVGVLSFLIIFRG